MSESYHRCGHCRGFFSTDLEACRYCGKNVPMKDASGKAKIYPDRATCRAIQIAEFEQLPKEAHDDSMRPAPELLDRKCTCLHCPYDAEPFEAVEMRWMATENMWACPCTTCGGRGFEFDIHLAEPLWQCNECQHRYPPPATERYHSRAKCPKCGCTSASGWFDDEPLTPEQEAEFEREYEEMEAKRKEEERLGLRPPREEWKPPALPEGDEENPFGVDEDDDDDDPSESWKGETKAPPKAPRMEDDIDFPRHFDKTERPDPDDPRFDDIPW